MLLVDDIQFLEGKEQIQEEFFHTFNSLHEAGRQIVISSDRPPKQIATLEDRLRSRFEWGLITDIQPPELETRLAILRKKVTTDAHRRSPTPRCSRSSPGSVSTTSASWRGRSHASSPSRRSPGCRSTVDLAEQVSRDLFPQGDAVPQVTIARIQEAVSDRFGMSVSELCSQKRSQSIAYPRQVAMYLSRELTDASLPKIGKEFGGRDHTTVIHANVQDHPPHL